MDIGKIMEMKKRYNPDDFEYEVKEEMEKIYAIVEGKLDDSLCFWQQYVWFGIKDAIKFEEIDPVEGREMQIFFMPIDGG